MGYREKAKAFFEGMSREEFIQELREAGFEVEDGNGEVIFTDNEETESDLIS